jgi:hypothetical protein
MPDLERVVTLLLWPLIGLIAWWARSDRPKPRSGRFVVHLALGPLMLVPLAWRFVTAPGRAPAAGSAPNAAPSGGPRRSGGRPVGQVDGQEHVTTGLNGRRRRRRHRRRGIEVGQDDRRQRG